MPSKRLNEFIEADRLEKEGKAKKTPLRPYVEKLLKRAKNLGLYIRGITYTEREQVKFDDLELYEWVKSQCFYPVLDEQGSPKRDEQGTVIFHPDRFNQALWESLLTTTIDAGKLEAAVEAGAIDLSQMPESCYTSSISPTITIKHDKLNH